MFLWPASLTPHQKENVQFVHKHIKKKIMWSFLICLYTALVLAVLQSVLWGCPCRMVPGFYPTVSIMVFCLQAYFPLQVQPDLWFYSFISLFVSFAHVQPPLLLCLCCFSVLFLLVPSSCFIIFYLFSPISLFFLPNNHYTYSLTPPFLVMLPFCSCLYMTFLLQLISLHPALPFIQTCTDHLLSTTVWNPWDIWGSKNS